MIPFVAQQPKDGQSVDVGQHPVEDDHVVPAPLGQGDGRHPVRGDFDDMPLGDQDAPDQARHLRFVFDHEDAHAPQSGRRRRGPSRS